MGGGQGLSAHVPWARNDDLFLAELQEGWRWQRYVAAELRMYGLTVDEPVNTVRDSIADVGRWTRGDCDLVIRGSRVGDCVLEVKSRPIAFHDPLTFPDPLVMVDTVAGWDAKTNPPRAVVIVSRTTRRMIVVSAATRPLWRVQEARDRVRGCADSWYLCPRALTRPLGWLLKQLQP